MGLDTTHDCYHGSYVGFNDWRDYLAQLGDWREPDIEFTDYNAHGFWDAMPDDPLTILMIHHDETGYICPNHAIHLADRLERILSKIEPDGKRASTATWLIRKTKLFIDGLREAAANQEVVRFS